jgi:hypothetical protein
MHIGLVTQRPCVTQDISASLNVEITNGSEQKRSLGERSLGARTALNLYILNDCSTPKAIISPKEDAQRPIEQLVKR